MDEAELQKQIVEKLKSYRLIDLISNLDEVDFILKKLDDEGFFSYFSIDYLLRLNYYKGCKVVLDGLDGDILMLNGKIIKNISMEQNEFLYPDLLFYNEETGNYIIGEIKKNKQAERQTVTELLGYQLEMKNHLPLIGNSEILLLLIALDYSTLLQHSLESLIFDHKPLLCLIPVISEGKFKNFTIFQPNCWTNMNYPCLKEEAFQGFTYCLYDKLDREKLSGDELTDLAVVAIEYLKSTSEKHGYHGFSVIWTPFNRIEAGCFITCFLINPYHIIYESRRLRYKETTNNPVEKNINENMVTHELHTQYIGANYKITRDMKEFLEYYVDPIIEFPADFKMFRKYLYKTGEPLKCDAWGEIGEAIRAAYKHKNVRNFIRTEVAGFNNPKVFFQIYDLLTKNFIFGDGFDRLNDFFQFGVELGVIISLCRYFTSIDCSFNELGIPIDKSGKVFNDLKGPILELRSQIVWRCYDLLNSLQDIQRRYPSIKLESLLLKDIENRQKIIQIGDYFTNFVKDFQNQINKNKNVTMIFELGIDHGAYFDDYFWKLISTDNKQQKQIGMDVLNNIYPLYCNILWSLICEGEINISSDAFQILIDLAVEFDITIADGKNEAERLKKEFSLLDKTYFYNVMNNFDEIEKLELVKYGFNIVIKYIPSFELHEYLLTNEEILKKVDLYHLIECIDKDEKNNEKVFLFISDNYSVGVAKAEEGSTIEQAILIKPKGSIVIVRTMGSSELIEYKTKDEIYKIIK